MLAKGENRIKRVRRTKREIGTVTESKGKGWISTLTIKGKKGAGGYEGWVELGTINSRIQFEERMAEVKC